MRTFVKRLVYDMSLWCEWDVDGKRLARHGARRPLGESQDLPRKNMSTSL